MEKLRRSIFCSIKNGRGKPAEAVLDNIIKEQKIKVDAVSGATNSSIVLEKAVENALNT